MEDICIKNNYNDEISQRIIDKVGKIGGYDIESILLMLGYTFDGYNMINPCCYISGISKHYVRTNGDHGYMHINGDDPNHITFYEYNDKMQVLSQINFSKKIRICETIRDNENLISFISSDKTTHMQYFFRVTGHVITGDDWKIIEGIDKKLASASCLEEVEVSSICEGVLNVRSLADKIRDGLTGDNKKVPYVRKRSFTVKEG